MYNLQFRYTVFSIAAFFAISMAGCTSTGTATLLYTKKGPSGGNEIWKQTAEGTNKTKLIANGEHGTWIPGTKTQFAFLEKKPGKSELKLWVAEEDGTKAKALTDFEIKPQYSWSPDGDWIAIVRSLGSTYGAGFDVFKIRVVDKKLVKLTSHKGSPSDPQWSQQGSIAYEYGDDIYVVQAAGAGTAKLLVKDGGEPSWSLDGSKLAYMEKPPGNAIKVIDVATGKVTALQSQCATCYDPTWLLNDFVFYGERYGQSDQIKRYEWKTGKTRTLGPVKNYAGETSGVFTANSAYLFWSRLPAGTGQRHIYAVQHYKQGAPDTSGGLKGEVDLGEGRQPDVW